MDDHVLTAIVLCVLAMLVIAVLALQYTVRYIHVVIYDLVFTNPFQSGLCGTLTFRLANLQAYLTVL